MRSTTRVWGIVLGMAVATGTASAQQAKTKAVTYPEDVRVLANLSYLGEDRAEKGDLYLPKEPPADGKLIPAVILIHGGGFVGGDKANSREITSARTLVQNGYAAFSINYELWTEDLGRPSWPQNLHDAKTAVRWLKVHGKEYGIDPERIAAIGFSAGATLSSLLALTIPEDGLDPKGPYGEVSPAVRCAMNFYGPADLTKRGDAKMLMRTRKEAPDLYRQASPVTYAQKGRTTAPLKILHGTKDTTVDLSQSEELAAALEKAGLPYELLIVEDAPHTFNFQPKQRDLRPVVLEFLGKHLKGE
jgi:acetyl esterase/lipase